MKHYMSCCYAQTEKALLEREGSVRGMGIGERGWDVQSFLLPAPPSPSWFSPKHRASSAYPSGC